MPDLSIFTMDGMWTTCGLAVCKACGHAVHELPLSSTAVDMCVFCPAVRSSVAQVNEFLRTMRYMGQRLMKAYSGEKTYAHMLRVYRKLSP